MTQDELAEKLFVSRDLVSKWETGSRRPDWNTIEEIAKIFGVSPETIADKNELVFKELAKCLPDGVDAGAEELGAAVNDFLKALNEREADLFIHRYYFLESASVIASLFGMKENHARSTLSRTRRKLKRYLKEAKHEKPENV